MAAALGSPRLWPWFSRALLGIGLLGWVPFAGGQGNGTTVYLMVDQAPKAVFPEADQFGTGHLTRDFTAFHSCRILHQEIYAFLNAPSPGALGLLQV